MSSLHDAVGRAWTRVIDEEPPGLRQEVALFLETLDSLGYLVVPKTDLGLT